MNCPSCGATVPEGNFCTSCGAPLPGHCPACGTATPPAAKFCAECGTRLGAAGRAPAAGDASAPPVLLPGVAAAEAERRQLTVMFVDLVGSTALSGRLDPEEMGGLLRAYQNAVAGEVVRFEGHVAKFMGDGVLAYFGWPRAHEDDAERAVRAGLEVVRAVGALTHGGSPPLQVRVGIATGLVVVGDLIGEGAASEEAVVGQAPNLAARLQTLAEPGSVAIGPTTWRLVGGRFSCAALGAHHVKGIAEPVHAWRVLGPSQAEDRFEARQAVGLTPLVGREQELELLLDRWQQAKGGEGQVVLLSGEPGIGKSRLVQALRERLGGEPYTPLNLFCSPYFQTSALHPVIGLLERATGFGREDPPEIKLGKLEVLLGEAMADVPAVAPLLAELLAIPVEGRYPPLALTPQQQKAKTFAALLAQFAGLAAKQPVLALWEDVHWSDPTTLELLDLIVDRAPNLPVLVLVTFRPEFRPPWIGLAHVTLLTLNRLNRRQVTAMVERVARGKALPPEVLEQIVAKTDGVPLFVEELTKAVLESELLQEGGDRYTLAGPLPALAIPATLYDSLMARLDRSAPVKEVAQMGAVIGREFSYDLLAAVAPLGDNELRDALAQLVEAELVFRRGTPPHATYTFKHALVQEAAYQSMLKGKRQRLHAGIAHVLAERFPEVADTAPELLAQHYTEAGQTASAADYWLKAGRRAAQTSANAEAMAHLTRGLAVLDALPDSDARARRELDLLIGLGATVRAARGFTVSETKPIYGRACELAERLGNSSQLVHALRGLWGPTYVAGEWGRGRQLVDRVGAVIRHTNDPVALTVAHFMSGVTLFYQGELAAARTSLETALGFYDPGDHRAHVLASGMDNGVHILNHLAPALWLLGQPDAAGRTAREALDRARGLAHPISTGLALHFACHVHELRREWGSAGRLADELIALSARHDFPHFQAWGVTQKGAALIAQGEVATGIADMSRGLADLRRAGDEVRRPFYNALLAGALTEAGRVEERLAVLAEALALVAKGERVYEAEVHRTAGELQLAVAGDRSEGEARLLRAVEVARGQQAKAWELRAATSLARLWADQGERRRAQDLLAPVYGWFTDGFDTPDLKDAKALLDELA